MSITKIDNNFKSSKSYNLNKVDENKKFKNLKNECNRYILNNLKKININEEKIKKDINYIFDFRQNQYDDKDKSKDKESNNIKIKKNSQDIKNINLDFQEDKRNNINNINKFFNIKNLFFKKNNRCIYKLISKEKALELILNEEVILIDVRTKKEYDNIHIKGAINIPLDQIKNSVSISQLNKDTKIIVYCATGPRSKTAISILNELGYSNILIWEYGAIVNFPYKNMFVYKNK